LHHGEKRKGRKKKNQEIAFGTVARKKIAHTSKLERELGGFQNNHGGGKGEHVAMDINNQRKNKEGVKKKLSSAVPNSKP